MNEKKGYHTRSISLITLLLNQQNERNIHKIKNISSISQLKSNKKICNKSYIKENNEENKDY